MQLERWPNRTYSSQKTRKVIHLSSNTFLNPFANAPLTLQYEKISAYILTNSWPKLNPRNDGLLFNNWMKWLINCIHFLSIVSEQQLHTMSQPWIFLKSSSSVLSSQGGNTFPTQTESASSRCSEKLLYILSKQSCYSTWNGTSKYCWHRSWRTENLFLRSCPRVRTSILAGELDWKKLKRNKVASDW